MRIVRGDGVCNEYGALNDPLKILGVERTLFFLSLMFALVLFVAMSALLLAIVGFGLFWLLARVTTAYDDRFSEVLRETMRNPGGWYDAADYGARPWHLVVVDGGGGPAGEPEEE